MGKVVKSIAKVGLGIATGGLSLVGSKAISGFKNTTGTDKFKANVRTIDKDAFKIKDADKKSEQAQRLADESESRSKAAQGNRSKLISDLQSQADGSAPSLAEAQLKSASDRSLAQQLGAAQAQRGGSAASRERQLLRNQASAGRDIAQQSAEARLQERNMAQQLLGQQVSEEQQLSDQLTQNYLAQGFNIEQARQQALADYEKMETDQLMAAQGMNLSGQQSAAQQRSGLFGGVMQGIGGMLSDENAKKKIKKAKKKDFKNILIDETDEGMSEKEKKNFKEGVAKKTKDKSTLGKTRKEVSINKKEAMANDYKKLMSKGSGTNKMGKAAGFAMAKGLKSLFSDEEVKINKRKVMESDLQKHVPAPPPPKQKESGGGMASMAPMLAMMSDEDSKKDMKAYSDKNIKKDFLDKLEAYTYEYKEKYKKDPRAGEGTHMSVMAQDLEKAGPIGKSMVKEDENGIKTVNYAKGYGAILAAQAHLNKRLEELEKKKKSKK